MKHFAVGKSDKGRDSKNYGKIYFVEFADELVITHHHLAWLSVVQKNAEKVLTYENQL